MTMIGGDTGIDLEAGLSLNIGRLAESADKLDRVARAMRAREIERAREPFTVRLLTSGVCPTPTVPFGLQFGGPDPGFYWNVRRIVVGGLTWTTTANGTAEVYITGLAAAPGAAASGAGSVAAVRSLSDLVDQAATLPSKGFYGNGEMVVEANESLVIVVNTGTAGQQYTAAASVQVVRKTTTIESEFSV